METAKYARQIAYKLKIEDILNSRYIKSEGEWEPNYIVLSNSKKASRVNILCVCVSAEESETGKTVVVDDGTGRIEIREFEKNMLKKINPGDIITIIGRIREFSSEKYILPEIIKKQSDSRWIEYRKKEIELLKKIGYYGFKGAEEEKEGDEIVKEDIKDSIAEESIKDNTKDMENKISSTIEEKTADKKAMLISLINSLDSGGGIDMEQVIREAKEKKIANAEEMIMSMLKKGDLFELRPGIIKAL